MAFVFEKNRINTNKTAESAEHADLIEQQYPVTGCRLADTGRELLRYRCDDRCGWVTTPVCKIIVA